MVPQAIEEGVEAVGALHSLRQQAGKHGVEADKHSSQAGKKTSKAGRQA